MNKIKAIAVSLVFFAVTACGGGITDSRDGKKYKTVKIGEQTWMAENLNIETGNSVCYDNNPENCKKYGRLYDWETAMKACPSGWRLPSTGEWENLVNFIGGENIVGGKLKAKSGWNNNGNGTDNYGFAALPGGAGLDGVFNIVGGYGGWWSSSEKNAINAYYLGIGYEDEGVIKSNNDKGFLLSVRCIKDETNENKTDDSKGDAVSKDAYCGELDPLFGGTSALTLCYQMKSNNKAEISLDAGSGSSVKLSGSYAQSGNKFAIEVNNEQANKNSYNKFILKLVDKLFDESESKCAKITDNPKGCKDKIKASRNAAKMLAEQLAEKNEYLGYSGDFLLIGNSLHILNENCQSRKSFTKKGSTASVAFDESKQFCYYGTIHDKCGGKAYDIGEQKCENNIVLTKCGDGWYNSVAQYCFKNAVKDKELTDPRDGKKYRTAKIGTQTWMGENLDYGGKNNDIGECYNGKPEMCEKYGALYSHNEAMEVCPSGWHLPIKDEWKTLIDFAGGEEVAVKKLKAKKGWSNESNCKYTTEKTTGRGDVVVTEHDKCATDEFGFAALPGGYIYKGGTDLGNHGYWWSVYVYDISKIDEYNSRSVLTLSDHIYWDYVSDYELRSVRCVKD